MNISYKSVFFSLNNAVFIIKVRFKFVRILLMLAKSLLFMQFFLVIVNFSIIIIDFNSKFLILSKQSSELKFYSSYKVN